MAEDARGLRLAFVDPASGVSGDMLLGAIIDCGVSVEDLNRAVGALPLQGVQIVARKVNKAGISATKADVLLAEGGGGGPAVNEGHVHRGLHEIFALLDCSSLPGASVARVKEVFRLLAEAEGRIHGVPPDQVHFHEVGAIDAIVDVVGVVEGLRLLGVEMLLCGPLPLTGGETVAAHGVIPLPAPATLELLRGFPVKGAPGEVELVTPTGAALMKAMARPTLSWPRMVPEAVGYGAGTRNLPRPNVLRLAVGTAWVAGDGLDEGLTFCEAEAARDLGAELEHCFLLECNIDDMNPQFYDYVQERMFEAGALDVFMRPAYMKKQRPGAVLSALCRGADLAAVISVFLRETTTIGVRGYRVTRWLASREVREVTTPYGTVRVKCAYLGGKLVNVAPEYGDCKALAASSGVPLKEVFAAALAVCGADRRSGGTSVTAE
ncbi:MAG: nickel pincer cofactor biosynthesis protein LarC [Bacillota bacterium]